MQLPAEHSPFPLQFLPSHKLAGKTIYISEVVIAKFLEIFLYLCIFKMKIIFQRPHIPKEQFEKRLSHFKNKRNRIKLLTQF